MTTTVEKDTSVTNQEEALLEFYRRLRPGEPPNVENAKNLLENLFFNPRRYDLGRKSANRRRPCPRTPSAARANQESRGY